MTDKVEIIGKVMTLEDAAQEIKKLKSFAKEAMQLVHGQQIENKALKDDNLHLNEFIVEKDREIEKLKELNEVQKEILNLYMKGATYCSKKGLAALEQLNKGEAK